MASHGPWGRGRTGRHVAWICSISLFCCTSNRQKKEDSQDLISSTRTQVPYMYSPTKDEFIWLADFSFFLFFFFSFAIVFVVIFCGLRDNRSFQGESSFQARGEREKGREGDSPSHSLLTNPLLPPLTPNHGDVFSVPCCGL